MSTAASVLPKSSASIRLTMVPKSCQGEWDRGKKEERSEYVGESVRQWYKRVVRVKGKKWCGRGRKSVLLFECLC